MASLISVRLNKADSASLGFRLQGGKDFGTPLVIQKVNGGSPAERAGLVAGDSVIKINNTDVFNLRHKDAQDVIIQAGPAFEVTVQRGGSTWKPSVIPTGTLQPTSALSPVTKTSLAAGKQENIGAIGTGHNLSAKPFAGQTNGINGGPKLVNHQYNTPVKLYSEQSIAETLSAQTEVLSTGALGVNFKKNEKNYDATNSAVFRMLQEAENEPRTPEQSETDSGAVLPPGVIGLRHVTAPETKAAPPSQPLPPGQNICADCERLIVGVFVRIKDKNLHVECFKCSTCGSSLKNVGYYNINNKLYCDVHAKLAARNNPPAPNLVPVTVPPGGKAPLNAISAALASHSLPSPSPLSPRTNLAQPFQPPPLPTEDEVVDVAPLQNLNLSSASAEPNSLNLLNNSTPLSFSKYLNKAGGNYSTAPRPFSSVNAPSYNTLPKAAPLSPLSPLSTPSAPAPPSSFSPASSTGRSVNIVWPPPSEDPELPSACPIYFAPSTHLRIVPKRRLESEDTTSEYSELDEVNMAHYQEPKRSLCSEEVCSFISERKSAHECVETISESVETQQLVESVMKNRPASPPPLPLPENCASCPMPASCDLKRLTDFKPNTIECPVKSQVENAVPQKWESAMLQALTTDPFTQIPKKYSGSALASGLTIAPSEPFTAQSGTHLQAVPLPEETVPYFPPEHPEFFETKKEPAPEPEKPKSQFVKALQTAPDRPFSPTNKPSARKKKQPEDELLKDLPKPDHKLTMRDALTTASERPYTPLIYESVVMVQESEQTKKHQVDRENLQRPLKPASLPASFQPKVVKPAVPRPYPVRFEEKHEETISLHKEEESTASEAMSCGQITQEIVTGGDGEEVTGMYPLFKGFSCSFENKSEHSAFSVEINTDPPTITIPRTQTPTTKITKTEATSSSKTESHQKSSSQESKVIEKQSEEVILKKPIPLSAALHKAEALPQYQVNLSENAEAEIQLMERVEAAKARHEQQKTAPPPQIIEPPHPHKPTYDPKPPNQTFSPRPRSVTPSMINKAPPTLPYYQSNLVAQHHQAAPVQFLDPASPAPSRSPSPCPGHERSPSPFPSGHVARAKSPAEGPPPNPLLHRHPPTRQDFRVDEARKSLTSYIPHHQEQQQHQFLAPNISETVACKLPEQSCTVKQAAMCSKREEGSTRISERSQTAQMEQQMRMQSVATVSDGRVQVERKKTVTEGFERTQKAQSIEIVSGGHPFRNVNNPVIEQPGVQGLHVTNPQHISSPFLQAAIPPPTKHVIAPSPSCPTKHVSAPSKKPCQNVSKAPGPDLGAGGGRQSGATVAPTRGRGVLNTAAIGGPRIALCASCHNQIRGPFITALGKIWCPDHFTCSTPSCRRPLQDLGFVEERGQLYCEYCFEQYLAPPCSKCNVKIKGDCLKAIGKNFHPECFNCVYCGKLFANNPFFLEDGNPYCEADWNELFTTKCFACGFPVEAGDRWVEALNNNYHSQCFNCTMCKKNLEGQSFFAKGGRPFCKNHAR